MNKLYYLIAALSLFIYRNVAAETQLSGVINKDSVLTLSASPYIVDGTLTVGEGFTLTIEAGVTVKIIKNQSIFIFGNLNATGSISDQIIFTSNESTPAAGDWSFFIGYYNHTSGTANMGYCQINYAYTTDIFSQATFENVQFMNSFIHGVNIEPNSGTVNITD